MKRRICEASVVQRGSKENTAWCVALAEEGLRLCAIHLRQSNYERCSCGAWMPPAPINAEYAHKCPSCGREHPGKD